MGIELILATFEDESDEARDAETLQRLADAVRGSLRKAGGTVDVDASTEEVRVDLPGGTAEIHSGHALFPIEQLDPLTLRVIFDVAKTGDMVVLTEGGDYSAIVMAPSQRARLPEAEWQAPHASPVCRSPKQLGRLLESWYRVHSDFRERAVADWTGKSESDHPSARTSPRDPDADWTARRESNHPVVRLSDISDAKPLSGPTAYRWDPWVGDHVANGPESELVTLHRFDPAGNGIPKHPDVLRELRAVCERHLKDKNEPSSRLIDDEEWPPLELRMRFYAADIWPDRVEFVFYELNHSVATLILEIARTGDMSFILPSAVILTDSGQATRLPQSWKETKRIVSCQSVEELKSLLRSMQLDIPPQDRDYGLKNVEPVPGTYPQRGRSVYIEAKPKETARKHQNKVYKHKPQSPGGAFQPRSGLLGADFWRLETPAGQRFFAYSYGGEGWMAYLLDFTSSEQRAMGSIVNFETFVQDDGQRFPIGDCEVRKVDPQEL